MGKFYLVVEGHGEVQAALNLVTRLWRDLELADVVCADPPIRGTALHSKAGMLKACALLRSKRDCDRALILRDEDDGCPAARGPEAARWIRDAGLPFPVATVLAHREFEAWFLPCVHLMAGRPLVDPNGGSRPGIQAGMTFSGDPEAIRGVKEWLSRSFAAGKGYKPTLDQLPLTRLIDFAVLRAARMSSFGTLERALRFLASSVGHRVYPA